jgi:acyl-CoA dehydrogenase
MDTETLTLLKFTVRRLVDDVLIPAEAEAEALGQTPAHVRDAMLELGLFGLTVPEAFGGLGLNTSAETQVIAELCRASPGFRSLIGTTVGVGGKSIAMDGTDSQKAEWLPRIATGDMIVSFCLTEPDSGSDAGSLRTRATRDGDDFIIDGRKRFISNAPLAGLFIVMARTDPSTSGGRGVSAFLVPADTAGIEVGPPLKKMGHKGALVADVSFDTCRVPASAILGGVEGQGFRTAMKVLDDGRLHIAAVALGLGRRLLEEAVQYAKDRKQFGQAISDFQLIQAMLADSETDLIAADAMIAATAAKRDAGERVSREAAATKYFATEATWRIADRAVQVHGGYGYLTDYPVERLFRDARLLRLFEGTSQVMQIVIARDMLK